MIENIAINTQRFAKIYEDYGYTRFKMNKFEEYDTYVKNKDFLISDKVITFTDTNGKLLALKPDVTISIIKNSDDTSSSVQRVYYKENVYRVSEDSHSFKEIMQSGLECIGNIDIYNICEVIFLAAKSLSDIRESFVLDISHLGLVSSVLKAAGLTDSMAKEILVYIGEKNIPAVESACENWGIDKEFTEKITSLISLYGPVKEVKEKFSLFCINDECKAFYNELLEISQILTEAGLGDNVKIDFSVVNDMNYYNGIVFRGYIEGVPTGILSGGQYDRLMAKMGKKNKAIGFAIYLDMLERLYSPKKEFDADVLLCYGDNTSYIDVFKKAQDIIAGGKTVIVQKTDDKANCREIIRL